MYIFLRLIAQSCRNTSVTVYCDNMPVVWMISKFKAKIVRPDLQCILREIALLLMHYEIHLWLEHVPGVLNKVADALSRYLPEPLAASPFQLQDVPSYSRYYLQRLSDLCRDYEIEQQHLAN